MWICVTHPNLPLEEEEDEWPKSQKSNRDFSGSQSHSDSQCWNHSIFGGLIKLDPLTDAFEFEFED